jgi:hypothetical protein
MTTLFWWIKHIALLLAGGFFLLFGIHLLISAYQLNDPFSFVMTFFASNFIILISAALLLGFVVRIFARKNMPEDKSNNDTGNM